MGNWIEDLDDEQEEKLRIMWADLFSDERYDEVFFFKKNKHLSFSFFRTEQSHFVFLFL